jgi:hypothetical protein
MEDFICLSCKSIGKPKKKKPGSKAIAGLAWTVFPLGLPYTLWRIFGKYSVCGQCGSTTLAAIDSPVGQRLLAQAMGDPLPPKTPLPERPKVKVLPEAGAPAESPAAAPPPEPAPPPAEKPKREKPVPQDPDAW